MRKLLIIFVIVFNLSHFRIANCQIPELYTAQGTKAPDSSIPTNWRKKGAGETLNLTFSRQHMIKGYVLYTNNYLDLKRLSSTQEELKEIEVSVAPEEYEPLTFVVFAIDELEDVKISISDLKSNGDNLLSKANIDVRVVSCFPQKAKGKTYTLKPILLERFNTLRISKNTYRVFWLTIYAPENTWPGTYVGEITINPSKKPRSFVRLKVKVLPFKLQKPSINFNIYYNLDNRWDGFYPGNLKKHLIDIREHGLDSVTIWFAPRINLDEEGLSIDFLRGAYCSPLGFDKFMREYVDTGFSSPSPYIASWWPLMGELKKATNTCFSTNKYDDYYVKAIKLIENHRKKMKWPEFLYSAEDEPANNEEKMKKAIHHLQLIKKAVPGARTYLTLNGLRKGLDEGQELDSWLDVRCYAFFNGRLINETFKSGDAFWIYNGGSTGKTKAMLDRYFYGFYTMKSKAMGISQWVYQWPISLESTPYNELFEQGKQGWYYTYPSANGPIPTQYWEAVREGIDDARYIFTLIKFINQTRNLDNLEIVKEAENSESILNNILSQVDTSLETPYKSAQKLFGYWLLPQKAKIMDEWREQIKREIIKLYNLKLQNNIKK